MSLISYIQLNIVILLDPSSYYYGSAYTYFGYSYGPIAWSYVSCNGWEKDLFACNKYNYYSCPSHYGVGVICKEGKYILPFGRILIDYSLH